MNVNIHMHIIRDNKMVKKDIFNNSKKDSDWFNNLQGKYGGNEYDHLPVCYGVPAGFEENRCANGNYNFGHAYMTVKEFCQWFEKYRPDQDSGWVTTKQNWLIKNKNYDPELFAKPRLTATDIVDDMIFIEYANKADRSRWLEEYLTIAERNGVIKDSDIIFYYFDED